MTDWEVRKKQWKIKLLVEVVKGIGLLFLLANAYGKKMLDSYPLVETELEVLLLFFLIILFYDYFINVTMKQCHKN